MNILPIIFLCLDIVSIQPNTIEKDNNQSTINNSNVYEEHYDNVQANQEDDSINSFSFNVDSYEPNDGYDSATKLSPNNFYSLDAYTVGENPIITLDATPITAKDISIIISSIVSFNKNISTQRHIQISKNISN